MNSTFVAKLVPAALAVAGAAALCLWLTWPFAGQESAAAPADGAGAPAGTRSGSASTSTTSTHADEPRGRLIRGEGAPAGLPGAWPQFRGPNRDGISAETVPLARQWPQAGPPALWSIEMGEGHAGPAVLNGRVYLLDYDRDRQADALRCLSLADGKEIWRYSYPVPVKRNHGMSRTVPAVTDKYVVTMGPKCHVLCLDAVSGERLWSIDLVARYGSKVPPWYAGQCPLIDGDRVILAPAGADVLMMAVECATGKVLWKTPNPRNWQMTHSSIAAMEFAGRKMYVCCGSGGVAGVSAEDGTILWDTTEWKIIEATVPTPVPVGNGRIFLSGGYDAGSMMLKLRDAAGTISAEKLFRLKPEVFGAVQHTPIWHEGRLYGVRPDGQAVCLDADGRVLWTSGREWNYGIGPFLLAQGRLFLVDDKGVLTMAEASPPGFKLLARAKVLPGQDSWGPLALAGGRLLARDLTRMVCLDLRAR